MWCKLLGCGVPDEHSQMDHPPDAPFVREQVESEYPRIPCGYVICEGLNNP